MKQFGQIMDKIGNKGSQLSPAQQLIIMRHSIMRAYGWIPYEEFRNLPAQEVLDLLHYIIKEGEQAPNIKAPKIPNAVRRRTRG